MKGPRKMTVYIPSLDQNGNLIVMKPQNSKDSIWHNWEKGDKH